MTMNRSTNTHYSNSTVIGSSAKEVRIIYAHLNEPTDKNDQFHPDLYGATVIIPKNSQALKDISAAYKSAREVGKELNLEIPNSTQARGFFLKDGDAENQKRVSNGGKVIEAYKNSYFFNVYSKFQPVLYDKTATEAYATDDYGRRVIVNNRPRYYLPSLNGSYVQLCLKFNVGQSVNGTYAKPYFDWVMQVEGGVSEHSGVSPTVPTWAENDTTTSAPKPQVQKPQAQPPQAPTQTTDFDALNKALAEEDDGIDLPFEL